LQALEFVNCSEAIRGIFVFKNDKGEPLCGSTKVSVLSMSAKERLIGDVDLILIPAFPASERRVMTMGLNRYPRSPGGTNSTALFLASKLTKKYRSCGGTGVAICTRYGNRTS
jgi:hypothetical protein